MLTIRATIHVAGNTVPQIIPVVQGDTARAILFIIADFTIPNGATANYYIQKPSGLAVYNSGTIDGNTVLVELTAQSIIEPGDNYLQIRILKDDDIVTSFDCILLVKPFRGIDATQSTGEMTIFDQAERAAAAQFQEDAESIAAEVIETIPPDYTALSNQVSDLSADLSLKYIWTGSCSTMSQTAAKTVSLDVSDNFTLTNHKTMVLVRFMFGNSQNNPTLNVNGTGAFPITYNDGNGNLVVLTDNAFYKKLGGVRLFRYSTNGTDSYWEIEDITQYDAQRIRNAIGETGLSVVDGAINITYTE